MRRSAFVTLAVALGLLSLAGCGGGSNPPPPPPPCDPVRLLAYWAPGGTPQAGFQVSGLAAAGLPAQLGCAQAGVVGVRVFAGTPLTIVPCTGAGACLDASTWRCDLATGGITVPLPAGAGTYDLQIDGFDGAGLAVADAKYSSGRQAVAVAACGDTAVGIFPQGLPGTMDLDYILLPASPGPNVNCEPSSRIEWDLFRGSGASAVLEEQGAIACGTINPFPVRAAAGALAGQGAVLSAGIYTLDRIAEVIPGTPALSVHALCGTVIVHAGNEVVGNGPVFLDLPFVQPGSACR
jgi:hypothetical protein